MHQTACALYHQSCTKVCHCLLDIVLQIPHSKCNSHCYFIRRFLHTFFNCLCAFVEVVGHHRNLTDTLTKTSHTRCWSSHLPIPLPETSNCNILYMFLIELHECVNVCLHSSTASLHEGFVPNSGSFDRMRI